MERQRKIFHLPIHSLDGCNSQEWTRPKQWVRNSISSESIALTHSWWITTLYPNNFCHSTSSAIFPSKTVSMVTHTQSGYLVTVSSTKVTWRFCDIWILDHISKATHSAWFWHFVALHEWYFSLSVLDLRLFGLVCSLETKTWPV